MDSVLMIFAWGAGLLSLFMVGDMIVADIASRRMERALVPARQARRSRS